MKRLAIGAAMLLPACVVLAQPLPPLEILAEAARTLHDEYVEPVDLQRHAGTCDPRLAAWLGKAVASGGRPGYLPADAGYASDDELRGPVYACINAISRNVDLQIELFHGAGYRELMVGAGGRAAAGFSPVLADPHPRVLSVARPGPAASAGVRIGDEILRVDGRPVGALAAWEISALLRGEPRSPVKVTFRRAGQEREVTLAREVIPEPESTVHARPGSGLLVARPAMRSGDAVRLARAMVAARPKGVILDLRSHPGGLLDEAVAVAATFVPASVVVGNLKGRHDDRPLRVGNDWRLFQDLHEMAAAMKDVPLVVLVDEHTSAGAELVAGALQGLKRAQVVGRTTRGKGTVATILPLGKLATQHMIRVPTARMVTPDGRRIEGQGIAPDVRVDVEDDEVELQAAERVLAGGK